MFSEAGSRSSCGEGWFEGTVRQGVLGPGQGTEARFHQTGCRLTAQLPCPGAKVAQAGGGNEVGKPRSLPPEGASVRPRASVRS